MAFGLQVTFRMEAIAFEQEKENTNRIRYNEMYSMCILYNKYGCRA